jgi:hypothetical protein
MDGIPVFKVKKIASLAENFGFEIIFDPQALMEMASSDSLFQPMISDGIYRGRA